MSNFGRGMPTMQAKIFTFSCFLALVATPAPRAVWQFLSGNTAVAAETPAKISPDNELQWPRPRFSERQQDRNQMVFSQIRHGSFPITNGAVLAALRNVPRHLFVPTPLQGLAYADRPLPIGEGQTISQPFIVAYMTEHLQLIPGDKVLEIGTGSGYQAAVLAEITPHVFSIEIIEELGKAHGRRLKDLGYTSVKTKVGDGYYGWSEYSPFDVIIVTCAAGHVPPALVKQLKPGGRIVIPIGGVYDVQMLIVVSKGLDGQVTTRQLIPVRFVPMTGKQQEKGE